MLIFCILSFTGTEIVVNSPLTSSINLTWTCVEELLYMSTSPWKVSFGLHDT